MRVTHSKSNNLFIPHDNANEVVDKVFEKQ